MGSMYEHGTKKVIKKGVISLDLQHLENPSLTFSVHWIQRSNYLVVARILCSSGVSVRAWREAYELCYVHPVGFLDHLVNS